MKNADQLSRAACILSVDISTVSIDLFKGKTFNNDAMQTD